MSEGLIQQEVERQIEATVTATKLVDEFPINDALKNVGAYTYDAEGPVQALLSIYARYGWPVTEIASVLLAVDQMDKPPETEVIAMPKQDDTILPPMAHTLSDGTRVATPSAQQVVIVPIETKLPDNWNFTYPHTPEELERRAEIAEDIGIYLATGAGKLMEVESPMRILEASPEVEKFDRYAKACAAANALCEPAYSPLQEMQDHQRELGKLYWAEVGLSVVDEIVDTLVIDGLMGRLDQLQQIMPQPSYLKNVASEEDISDEELMVARHTVEQQARHAQTDLRLFMHTTPDAPGPIEAIVTYE